MLQAYLEDVRFITDAAHDYIISIVNAWAVLSLLHGYSQIITLFMLKALLFRPYDILI